MKRKISLGAIMLLGAGVLLNSSAFANPSQGARCPNGYTANFSNNVLKCSKTHRELADVICPTTEAPLNLELVTRRGRDVCKVPGMPLPKDLDTLPKARCLTTNGSGWTVEKDLDGSTRDRCVRTKTEYACPTCSP